MQADYVIVGAGSVSHYLHSRQRRLNAIVRSACSSKSAARGVSWCIILRMCGRRQRCAVAGDIPKLDRAPPFPRRGGGPGR